MSNPKCKAANCLRISWSRGLCQPCYTATNKRRSDLQDGGLSREAAWRRAIDEITSTRPLPALQIMDPKREQDYLDLIGETVEICDALGIDRTVDYDLVKTVRAVAAERDTLKEQRRRFAHLADARGGALDGFLSALNITLEADCAPAWNEEEGAAPAYRWGHAHGTAKLAEMRGKLTAEAAKVAELTETICQIEAKLGALTAAASAPTQTWSLEWEADSEGLMLRIVAAHYRFVIAEVDADETGCALKLLRWTGGETQTIKAANLPEAVAIITALLALRGITVPPYLEAK
jgi:hypothetical protein